MLRIVLPIVVLAGCARAPSTEDKPPRGTPSRETQRPEPAVAKASGWIELEPGRPLAAQLAEQSALAVKSGLKPHAYLHADWCPPCVAIEKTRDDARMKAAFAGTHILAIDTDRIDNKQIEAAGLELGTWPVFYRLDEHGRPSGAAIDGGAWGDNIPETMAPPLREFFAQ